MSLVQSIDLDSLEEITIPVSYKGVKYILKEATGEVAIKYKRATTSGMRVSEDTQGNRQVQMGDNLGSVDVILVAGCLFLQETDRPIGEEAVCSWPNKHVKKLADKIREISSLDKDEEPTIEDLEKEKAELQAKIDQKRKEAQKGKK